MKLIGHTKVTDYKTGEILYDHHNVITIFGKTRVAELLGGLDTNYIDRMAIGNGGAPSGTPSAPDIPLDTDTGLDDEVLRTSSINPTIVGTNQLKFTAVFLTTPVITFPGGFNSINEVGLFFQDDDQPVPASTPAMFARNTFPSIPFLPADREGVFIDWTITIV